MGSRMKTLVAELTNEANSKTKKAAVSKELAKIREAYRLRLLSS
jgi:flagellin-like hook-associated protein FlgL